MHTTFAKSPCRLFTIQKVRSRLNVFVPRTRLGGVRGVQNGHPGFVIWTASVFFPHTETSRIVTERGHNIIININLLTAFQHLYFQYWLNLLQMLTSRIKIANRVWPGKHAFGGGHLIYLCSYFYVKYQAKGHSFYVYTCITYLYGL